MSENLEADQHTRQLAGTLLKVLEAKTLDEALINIARLREKAGILAAVCRLVDCRPDELFPTLVEWKRRND